MLSSGKAKSKLRINLDKAHPVRERSKRAIDLYDSKFNGMEVELPNLSGKPQADQGGE
jgi:hypothetical protein